MPSKRFYHNLSSILTCTTFIAGLPLSMAYAQTATPSTASSNTLPQPAATPGTDSRQLEQIVVTAQRRSERLQRTPVSVTALSANSLKKQSVTTNSDLQLAVAGLLVRQSITSNQVNFAIRGQSIDAFTGSQPGVLPYFDEIQLDTHAPSQFYDLQSIQALKGPQGTLFGRNATGGAVLITSAKPTNDYSGYITTRAGNYGYTDTEGAVNIPIVPGKVLLRLAGDYDHRAGYVNNVFSNTTSGTTLREAGRMTLEIKPTDWLTNVTVIDYTHAGGSNTPAELYSVYAPGSTNNGVPLTSTSAGLYSPLLDAAIGFPGAWQLYLSKHPGANPLGLGNALQQQQAHGAFWDDAAGIFTHRSDATVVSNITSIGLGSETTLRNIFGFVNSTDYDQSNTAGTPYVISSTNAEGDHADTNDYSEELQILGKLFADQLTYVTGFYFSSNKEYHTDGIQVFDLSPIIQPTSVIYSANEESTSYAGYAQGTYNLSKLSGISGLGFTAGLRYTGEEVSQTELPGSIFYDSPGLSNHLSQSVTKLSWQFGMQEQLNQSLLFYVVSRHSFRSGGYNPDSAPIPGTAQSGGAAFYPEETTDVEVGEKYQGHLGSAPVRLNADLFNQWVSNAQRAQYVILDGALAALTVNVPEAEISGFEADAEISPLKWLDIGASLTYTDARYTNGETEIFGQATSFGPYADTPRWTGTAFAEAIFPMPRKVGTLSLRTDIFAQSRFYFSNLNNTVEPDTSIPGYGLVNFRMALDNIEGTKFSVAGYVKNAFNKQYYAGGIAVGSSLGLNEVQPGLPRMFYVEGSYKF